MFEVKEVAEDRNNDKRTEIRVGGKGGTEGRKEGEEDRVVVAEYLEG